MTEKGTSIAPVVKAVTVACTPEEAFHYFTTDFGRWWPTAATSVVAYASGFKDRPVDVIFEARVGGRIFECTRTGDTHTWGRVLVWEPPTRVVFSFHPGRDEKMAQTVEVAFSPARGGAKVVLTHRDWEGLGSNAQQARDRYDQGWEAVFVAAFPEFIHTTWQQTKGS